MPAVLKVKDKVSFPSHTVIQYIEVSPPPSLFPFIECVWTLKSHANYFRKCELIIPGGRIEMIFNFGDPMNWIDSKDLSSTRTNSGSYILGPRNRPFFVEQNGIIDMLGVRFRHGGLTPFTSMPMNLLMNAVVPQDQIFGSFIDTLTSRISETTASQHHVNLIEDFLTKRIHADTDTFQTFRLISKVKECDSSSFLKSLRETTGVHYKKLERVFSKYTGYNPKNFTRVVRFYRALHEMKKHPSDLTGIGFSNGYYDQPHFIRDFKTFTGKSPTQFHKENPAIANLLLQSQHV